MKKPEPGLLRVVHEDLSYICESWPSGSMSDAELRRGSTILRRLASYHDLITVWVEIAGPGQDYQVEGTRLKILFPHRIKSVEFATCSPARHPNGATAHAMTVMTGVDINTRIFLTEREPKMPLKRFLTAHSMIVDGVPINRDTVIQFVANERGGAHFGSSKSRPSDIALRNLRATMNQREILSHEILSYGQTLASSASTRALLAGLETRLGF